MSSALEKLQNATKANTREAYAPRSKFKNMYLKWREGDNQIRLVGTPFTVHGHFLAEGNTSNGVCVKDAFGKGGISKSTCCLNWDVKEGKELKGDCPLCQIEQNIRQTIREGGLAKPDLEALKKIQSLFRPSNELVWNVIDRADPFIIKVDGEKETKVSGYKVARISGKTLTDIRGIFEQLKIDLSDPKDGLDIIVTKVVVPKVSYSAKIAMNGLQAAVTPLTKDELELTLHDIAGISNHKITRELILKWMRPEYLEYLDLGKGGDEAAEEAGADTKDIPF